jgi:hypothetical protein
MVIDIANARDGTVFSIGFFSRLSGIIAVEFAALAVEKCHGILDGIENDPIPSEDAA